jgi:hypothetical protein
MHGGLLNGSDQETEMQYRMNSINGDDDRQQPLLQNGGLEGMGVSITHIAGTIETDEKARLKKLLFRATRGKALTYFQEIPVDEQRAVNPGQPVK